MSRSTLSVSLFLRRAVLVLAGGLAALVLNGSSCETPEVLPVYHEDEIMRYIAETEEGQALFGTEGFITATPYTTPLDNAVWTDSVLDHTRTVTVSVLDIDRFGPADWGDLGLVREAWAFVTDLFVVQSKRDFGGFVRFDTTQRTLVRYGFFLKLGEDFRPYLGWKLYGFNGIGSGVPPVYVWMMPDTGALFIGDETAYSGRARKLRTDLTFLPLDEIRDIGHGEAIVCSTLTANTAVGYRTYQLLGAVDSTGAWRTERMNRITREVSLDTIFTPSPNPRLWNLIYLQSFDDDTLNFRQAWAVPFRVPQ